MKEFNNPNVKASRYRPQVKTVLNKEFFENFKKKYPKYKSFDNKLIRKIIKRFNQVLYENVIETRDGVQLPEQLGWIFIGTCQKSKKANVDYAKSKQYGVKVSNKNWETDGKLAKIFFTNYAPKLKMKNREYWGFTACREFKRAVSKSYPENWNMYTKVLPSSKIDKVYNNVVYKDFLKKADEKALKKYNEFDDL
jgi:hypothetical protein